DELRSSFRTLGRSPGFVAVSVLSLGLSIALATTVYGVIDAMIYPKYPYRAQSQLYEVSFVFPPSVIYRGGGKESYAAARQRYSGINDETRRLLTGDRRLVESAAGYTLQSGAIARPGGAPTDRGVWLVSSNFFDVVGMRPH